jgi:drug/metabolite transporter (DMT)-like permease
MLYFSLPASLDVLGSGVSGIGMLFISASVWQMMRGSLILFTAALSVLVLGRRLDQQHVLGLVLATIGLAFVGLSSWLDSEITPSLFFLIVRAGASSASDAVFGITLTVLSQLCTAIQVVVEESLLKIGGGSEYKTPSPERVVAYEGLWGCLIMVGVLVGLQLYPGQDHGSAENTIDSMEKLFNSWTLIFLVVFYLISIAIFNVLGMTVSKHLSSVHRTLIDSSRSVVVWGVQLVAWHLFESRTYGTPWTSNSWIQLLGFIILVIGTLVYNDVVVVFRTRQPEETASELLPMNDGSE